MLGNSMSCSKPCEKSAGVVFCPERPNTVTLCPDWS